MSAHEVTYGFIGTGGFAAMCLGHLCSLRPPQWVVTSPARPAGRGVRLTPSPVARLVSELASLSGVPIVESASASKDESVLSLTREIPVDVTFVTDLGQMIREPLLRESEAIGCLNIHPSLLPLYRGAAPVQRAIMDGVRESGVTIFKLERGMDSGPILLQVKRDIEGMNAESALALLAKTGADAFIDLCASKPISEWTFTKQDESLATYAAKIAPEEERVDWSLSADVIVRKVRALSPRPGAWTTFAGRRIRMLDAEVCGTAKGAPGDIDMSGDLPAVSTGDGSVVLLRVQPEGKREQSAADWKNGARNAKEARMI